MDMNAWRIDPPWSNPAPDQLNAIMEKEQGHRNLPAVVFRQRDGLLETASGCRRTRNASDNGSHAPTLISRSVSSF
jgi:hypothetical protein